ncbi:MAG: universal stress protein [Planctomycetales bacterium]|nr:universal stress protein [Planctomycetales bacterium]
MNIKRILFPTDFSHTGDKAMQMAESLARDSGAKIIIVHVEEPPTAYGGGEMYYGMIEPDLAQLKEMLAKVKPSDPQIDYEHHMITGEPSDAIARFADEHQVDIIVLGTHGRTGLLRLLMGSVAEAIVRRSKCAVLCVKPPNGEE